jgi:hypothetical protein
MEAATDAQNTPEVEIGYFPDLACTSNALDRLLDAASADLPEMEELTSPSVCGFSIPTVEEAYDASTSAARLKGERCDLAYQYGSTDFILYGKES